jgi:hypothetical protein
MRGPWKSTPGAERFIAMLRHVGSFALLLACGDPPPPPALTAEPSRPGPIEHPVEPPPAVPPAAPAPSVNVEHGEVHYVARRRWGAGTATVLLEAPDAPRPEGPVVGYAETHHSYWAFREIAVEPPPTSPIVLVQTYPSFATCETRARRARRLHGTHLAEEGGADEEFAQATFLALEIAGCEGSMALLGVHAAGVTSHRLDGSFITDPAPVELVDLVREADSAYGAPPAAADYRMLVLPQLDLTLVRGRLTHVVRDGRRWNERWGGDLDHLIEAGGMAFFAVSSVAEDWSSSLDCFYPTHAAGTCEITDPSGTPTNVRGGPSGRSPVVTTVSAGVTVPADDRVGSWFHVRTTPAGWVHESAVRCAELVRQDSPCDG